MVGTACAVIAISCNLIWGEAGTLIPPPRVALCGHRRPMPPGHGPGGSRPPACMSPCGLWPTPGRAFPSSSCRQLTSSFRDQVRSPVAQLFLASTLGITALQLRPRTAPPGHRHRPPSPGCAASEPLGPLSLSFPLCAMGVVTLVAPPRVRIGCTTDTAQCPAWPVPSA